MSNSASDIKVAGSEIGDIVENGIKDIKIETKAEYEKVAGIYGKSNYENQGIEGRVIFA